MKMKMRKKIRQFMAMFLCILMISKLVVPTLATVVATDSNASVNVEHVVLNTGENSDDVENTGSSRGDNPSRTTSSNASKASSSNATPSNAICEICGKEPCECVICGICGNKNCTEHTAGSENGPQVGDEIWIRSGSKVYKEIESQNAYKLKLSYKVKIINILLDDENQPEWYEFRFTSQGIFEAGLYLAGYKYVHVENTSVTEPDDSQTGNGQAGTTVDGMEITVAGIPDGVTVSAETIVPREYNHEVFKIVGSKKIVFAVDINLSDGADEWQPESGKSVTVSLDAEALGLKDGDKIGILHEHDGGVKKLGSCTVEEGKLTFATDGFSTFYGYTVDFEYDGTWYSIGGGSGIYLYELFAQLEIRRETSEIESIDVTDDTLLEVSEKIVDDAGKKEWHIQSLAAFDTEEVMTITFKTGNPIVINVYDAKYTSLSGIINLDDGDTIDNLAIYEDVVLNLSGTVTMNGQIHIPSGKKLTIQGNGTLKRGDTYSGILFYVEGTLNIKGNETSTNAEHSIILDGGAKWTSTDIENSTRKKLNVENGSDVKSAAIYVKYSTVNLENITIQNFYSSDQSPVIYGEQSETSTKYGVVTMNKVTVQKCATTGDHSITLFNECIATLTECKYLNNYSGTRYAGTLKAGGPGHFCQLTMNKCYAKGNYSSGWGGVLLWAANRTCGENESKSVINECTFEKNTARYLGGAISNEAMMEVKDTTLKNNVAMAGGGIATFPYTRTKETDAGKNGCGLILKGNNNIINNSAEASNEFTPFSKLDSDGKDGDDILIDNGDSVITYIGGGGGVWCYMNKDKWTCSLEISNGNTIANNTAKNAGGGVYIDHVAGEATTLSITGAEISGNKAKNGGGIATHNANVIISSGEITGNEAESAGGGVYVEKDAAAQTKDVECTISGEGTVKNNQSANGGGIYIKDAKLKVTGGVVAFNQAVCQSSHQTEGKNDTAFSNGIHCGVGGGIYLAGGTFNMTAKEGASVGIHSNTASYAAADVYSSGSNTTLTLPKVDGMNLAEYSGKATGWYVDYCEGDKEYPDGISDKANPGRYEEGKGDNVQVDPTKLESTQTYYCLTLGKTQGTLIIKKQLIGADNKSYTATEDQSFLFHVKKTGESTDTFEMDVVITVKKGQSEASITITNIPEGTYMVTEDGNWSWRFECVNENPKSDITVSYVTQAPEIQFKNKLKNEHWLSDDCYCKNLFKGNSIEKIGSDVTSGLKQKGGSV